MSMLKRRANTLFRKAFFQSTLLHIFCVLCGLVNLLTINKNDVIMMEVEMAGEGAMQPIINNAAGGDEHRGKMEDSANQNDNVKPEPQPEPVQATPQELVQPEPQPEPVDDQIPDTTSVDANDNATEENHELDENGLPDNKDKIKEEERKKEIEEEQHRIEELKKKKEKKEKEEALKKKKKQKKQALLDAIKKADAQDKKKKEKRALIDQINQSEDEDKKKKKDQNKKTLLEAIAKAEKNGAKILDGIEDSLNKDTRQSSSGRGKGQKGDGVGSFGYGQGLTEDDRAMIASQIYSHWAVPSGIKDAENFIIDIHVSLRENGEVIISSVQVLDENRYNNDNTFRAAADSARRAILSASPLSIPKDKIDMFRSFTFKFNLKEALGGAK